MNILVVSSSANGDASVSNGLVARFVDSVRESDPAARVVLRDVGANPLPHLTHETVAAIKGEPSTPAELEARALSDALIGELQQADLILIASPMYNFGISSTLKSWFDHVARAGVTFRYTENGPEGLLKGKKTVAILSRAGFYSEARARPWTGRSPICAPCSASSASMTSAGSGPRSLPSGPRRRRRRSTRPPGRSA